MQSPHPQLFCLLLTVIILACSHETLIEERIIAQVGNRKITLEEFRLFYELDPGFGVDSAGLPALYGSLDAYIDRVMAWERLKDDKISSDTLFNRAIRWEKRQAMLRQLYRDVVSNKIDVTEEEIMQEIQGSRTRVHLRHLFSTDLSRTEAWYQELQSGQDFNVVAREAFQDSVLAENGGDLGWVLLNDLDEDFAKAAGALRRNEISPPIRTKWGYHIIQLLDRKDELIITQQEFLENRSRMEKRIRRRKSRQASGSFIRNYIGDLNPQPDRHTVQLLIRTIVPAHELEQAEFSQPYTFTNSHISALRIRFGEDLKLPLIRYRNGEVSLGEYLERLYEIPLGDRPRFTTVSGFANDLGVWIRDELLLEEALRRGLNRHPRVIAELERFSEEQAFLYYLRQTYEQSDPPDSVIRIFADGGDKSRLKQQFHTLQAWQWDVAKKNLHRMLRRNDPVIHVDSLQVIEENKRIDWRKRIPMIMLRNPS